MQKERSGEMRAPEWGVIKDRIMYHRVKSPMTQERDENVLRAFGCHYYFSSFVHFLLLTCALRACPVHDFSTRSPRFSLSLRLLFSNVPPAFFFPANCQQKQHPTSKNISETAGKTGIKGLHVRIIRCDIKSFRTCHSCARSER